MKKFIFYFILGFTAVIVGDFASKFFMKKNLSPKTYKANKSSRKPAAKQKPQEKRKISFGKDFACFHDDQKCMAQGRKLQQENQTNKE